MRSDPLARPNENPRRRIAGIAKGAGVHGLAARSLRRSYRAPFQITLSRGGRQFRERLCLGAVPIDLDIARQRRGKPCERAQHFFMNALAGGDEFRGPAGHARQSFYEERTAGRPDAEGENPVAPAMLAGKMKNRRFVADLSIGQENDAADNASHRPGAKNGIQRLEQFRTAKAVASCDPGDRPLERCLRIDQRLWARQFKSRAKLADVERVADIETGETQLKRRRRLRDRFPRH